MSDTYEKARWRMKRAAADAAISGLATATLWSWGADMIKDAAPALDVISSWIAGQLSSSQPVSFQLCREAACIWPLIIKHGPPLALGLLWLLFGFLLAYSFAIPKLRQALSSSFAVVQRDRKSRGIVLTLSPLKHSGGITLAKEAIALAEAAKTTAERRDVLKTLCDPKGKWGQQPYWPWQQPLRLLQHNFSTLEVMGYVLSEEAAPQFTEYWLPLLGALKPEMRILYEKNYEGEPEPVELSDYNAVSAALDRIWRDVMAAIQCDAKDLCIDITGGFKAYSAAATVLTLNSETIFSYVETGDRSAVLTYDALSV